MTNLQSDKIVSIQSSIGAYLMFNDVPAAIRPYKLEIEGLNGNAYAIMAYTMNCMKAEDKTNDEVNKYLLSATEGDYDTLINASERILKELNESKPNYTLENLTVLLDNNLNDHYEGLYQDYEMDRSGDCGPMIQKAFYSGIRKMVSAELETFGFSLMELINYLESKSERNECREMYLDVRSTICTAFNIND